LHDPNSTHSEAGSGCHGIWTNCSNLPLPLFIPSLYNNFFATGTSFLQFLSSDFCVSVSHIYRTLPVLTEICPFMLPFYAFPFCHIYLSTVHFPFFSSFRLHSFLRFAIFHLSSLQNFISPYLLVSPPPPAFLSSSIFLIGYRVVDPDTDTVYPGFTILLLFFFPFLSFSPTTGTSM
jgi:hypothetical protein